MLAIIKHTFAALGVIASFGTFFSLFAVYIHQPFHWHLWIGYIVTLALLGVAWFCHLTEEWKQLP